jgi:hypothetical protein
MQFQDQSGFEDVARQVRPAKRWQRTVAMYFAMVAVSTCTIFLLEHVSLMNAFRTALVAAIGKTIAANWVASMFD